MCFPISVLLVVFALWAPCSAIAQFDDDQDGFFTPADCDDTNSEIHPGADDLSCDGTDTDCDGTIETWYHDADGDGVGTNSDVLFTCTQPLGYVAIGFDCDDNDPLRFPGALDPCDGFDADCDGNGERWYVDLDGDGYGVLGTEVIACVQPPNTVLLTGDCNDNEPNVSPGVAEICGDGLDNDCNGTTDDQSSWYEDADGDGFGTGASTLLACVQPAGYVPQSGDCDDSNNGVYPLAGPGIGCASCSLADQQYIQEQYSQIWNVTGITIADATPGLTGQAAWNALVSGLQPFLSAISPSCRQCVVERAYCAYLSCATACVPWQLIGTGGIYPGTPTCNQCVALGGCSAAFNACVGVIDQDGDGYLSTNDCNDLDPVVNLGADELCDGIDNDCDGILDNFPPVFADTDGDGFGDPNAPVMCATPGSVPNNTDCDDTDGAIHPNAAELIDGIDNDCDGQVDEIQCNDIDGDGTTDCQGDCNDNEPSVFPGAAEVCGDGLDNDCNGTIDDPTTWYQDTDGDGFGTESNTLLACVQPAGYSVNPGDCDDANAGVYPLAGPGIGCASCSLADQQYIQEQYSQIWNVTGIAITDATPGLTGQAAWNALVSGLQPFLSAISPSCRQCVVERAFCAYTSCAIACIPWQLIGPGNSYPGTTTCNQCVALGGCNATFNACVGVIDQDGDGYLSANDCDDTDATVYASALELCDGIDNDCNGQIDEGAVPTWFADLDGDGFGDNATGVSQCTAPPGFIDIGNDCDDTNSAINPGTSETCNGIDDDCNGTADDVLAYADMDGDGFGDVNNPVTCSFPDAVLNNSDCDDTDPNSFPGAIDACLNGDGVDNDCNGQVDEDGLQLWYLDADLDGSGVEGTTLVACTQPVGFAPTYGDCDDTDATVYPGAPELCDNLDNDCDPFGETDEGFYWYTDADGDGFGLSSSLIHSCTPIPGRITIGGDCDDTDPAVHIPATLVLFWSDGLSAQYVITNGGNTYTGEILQAPLSPSIGVVNLCLTDGCVEVSITTSGTAESPIAQFGQTVLGDVSGTITFLSSDGLTASIGEPALEVCDGVDNDCDQQVDEGCAGCIPADIALLASSANGIVPEQGCVQDCSGSPDLIACVAQCYANEGLSIGCATCVVEYQFCVATQCAACEADPHSAACLQCLQTSGCAAQFTACSGLVDADLDGAYAPFDCDDTNASVYPDAPEGCTVDGLDNDCDGLVDEDSLIDGDGDGFTVCAGDCDDLNASANPDATEACDGFDNNCNGVADEGFPLFFQDLDGDGFGDPNAPGNCSATNPVSNNTDCDDEDPTSHPGADEICDGIDNDCNGTVDDNQAEDTDNDGFTPCTGDCDDTNDTVFPGAPELCDGLDNDCNGAIELSIYADLDGDGFGDAANQLACGSIGVTNDDDCDDTDPLVTLPQGWFVDADGDGYGASGAPIGNCTQPMGAVGNSYDCDDTNANIFPGQGCTECSPMDLALLASDPFATAPSQSCLMGCSNASDPQQCLSDCIADNGLSPACADCIVAYQYCLLATCPICLVDPESPACQQCQQSSDCATGFSDCSGLDDADGDGSFAPIDCDDANPAVYPGNPEVCDGLDNDCNGQVDDGLPQQYADNDGDGYGDPLEPLPCDTPGVANSQDCDDNDPDAFPRSTVGFNCIGCSAADQLAMSQNLHLDNGNLTGPYLNVFLQCAITCSDPQDPVGSQLCLENCIQQGIPVGSSCLLCLTEYITAIFAEGCDGPCEAGALASFQVCAGLVDADGDGYFAPADCDDQDPTINPNAIEICDGADNNCDGNIDEINAFADLDGDGFGDVNLPVACGTPGSVGNSNDCNDASASQYPGAPEVCDLVDNDCDGIVDDGLEHYADLDGDGYGDPIQALACSAPGVTNNLDCDDTNANIFPEQGCDGCGLASQVALSQNLHVQGDVLAGPYVNTVLQCFLSCSDPDDPAASLVCLDACLQAELPMGASCSHCLALYVSTVFALECNQQCRADALAQFTACTRLADADGDGYFAPADCNEQNAAVFPGAVEVCDGADNDCDGQVDEAGGVFADNDGDGFGNPNVILACGVPGVTNGLDCNDNNAQQYPGGPLPCPDCSPADQALILSDPDIFATATSCFGQCIGQGANATNCTSICLEEELSIGADCADCVAQYVVCVYSTCTPCLTDPNSAACLQCRNNSPCNTAYENCSGLIDNDNDGAYVFEDCDDTNASIYPNAPELCDGLDNDCDGQVDDGAPLFTVYLDADSDGFGTDVSQTSVCPIPPGYVTSGGDCDDNDDTRSPGAPEICNGIDDNCDGQVDDGFQDGTICVHIDPCVSLADYQNCACVAITTTIDSDGDGFCAATECNDADPSINPVAAELCDGLDNDCDGSVDENCSIRLAAKVLLEGPYVSSTSRMGDGMRALGLVPTTEPYTGIGYAHLGGGDEVTEPAVLEVTGDDAVVDWVLLELRSSSAPATILATRSALVQRDGDVVDVDGLTPVGFPGMAAGNYHVAVLHRNHLGCMTAGPVALSPTAATVDFSSSATAMFGTAARKALGGTIPVHVLWAGDVTFNGQLKYTGSGNDRDPLLTTVGSTTPNNTVTLYSTRDVNMNGQVKYTGSANDRDPILVNVGSTTPNNVRQAQLP